MSGSKVGFWARLGGMLSSLFLRGKDRQRALDISRQVGDVADEVDEEKERKPR